ncbi:VOC family protein [Streptomyces sp. Y7]|uniref:VOC family protein n=1 Tax=Streptomyces sp. Y7 TaxID=3342392 RepID=UPI003714C28F
MTLRVTGLLHFGLQVPDLSQGEKFYADFGLDTQERDSRLVVRCDGREQDQAVLSEGPAKALGHVAFGIESGCTQEWARHLQGQGLKLLDAPAGGQEGGLWFRDLDGNHVNLREEPLAEWRSFGEQTYNFGDATPRVGRAAWQQYMGGVTKPRRMGHLLVFSSDNEKSEQFYARTLGMKLSDKIPGRATFMHSAPGDHHIFGFIQSTHPGLHHTSWEVANIDEIALGAQTMSQRGHHEAWGLGRHTLGSNLFTYIRDPWGSWVEYFSDIDKIADDWEPRSYDVPPAVWCAVMPKEFHANLETPRRS